MATEQPPTPTLARVRQIETKRLFGLYDHVVPLNLKDRVTIVHGANGVGKTVLIRLVNALFAQDYFTLLSVPYSELIVTLVDGTQMQVTQPRAKPKAGDKVSDVDAMSAVRIAINAPNGDAVAEFEIRLDQIGFQQWAQQLAGRSSWLHAMGPDRYYDPRTETQYTALELWRQFAAESSEKVPLAVMPSAPFKVHIASVKTHLVEAQRLMRMGISSTKVRRMDVPFFSPAVLVDAQEIAARLKDVFAQYGLISQKLDQTFPQRLFNWRQTSSLDQIKKVLSEIEDDQAKLATLGLLDAQPGYPLPLSTLDSSETAKLDAMELFVTDGKEKLKPLIEFASRIEPMLSNINAKFKNKAIRIDREKGLVAIGADGSEIRADQLSSGEQHEIVLLFHLLFRVPENALVLIDEPELSLHIDWQRRFLPEFLAIAGRAQIDALVATHSPYIVGERDDLMIDLESRQGSAA